MFTGIILELGEITKIDKKDSNYHFEVKAEAILENKKIGQSIAVNGVCVTIVKINKNSFEFQAMPETLKKTNLGSLKINDLVNLEPALKLNQEIDGHLIQGHVDTMGVVIENKISKRNILKIGFPKEISDFLAFKGSICLNGVSLTISLLEEDSFNVDLIPLTLQKTNLGKLKKGDKVNIEVDLIARYLQRQLKNKEKEARYVFLKERNLI